MKDLFIQQTAKDYDMSYDKVKEIHKKWSKEGLFYTKLEEYIKERANN